MRQHVLSYQIGGIESTRNMAKDLNEWINKGWVIKSVTNVYNNSYGYNIVVIEELENTKIE